MEQDPEMNVLPAPPIPATARAKIKKFTLGATAQNRDPISNHVTDAILRIIDENGNSLVR